MMPGSHSQSSCENVVIFRMADANSKFELLPLKIQEDCPHSCSIASATRKAAQDAPAYCRCSGAARLANSRCSAMRGRMPRFSPIE